MNNVEHDKKNQDVCKKCGKVVGVNYHNGKIKLAKHTCK